MRESSPVFDPRLARRVLLAAPLGAVLLLAAPALSFMLPGEEDVTRLSTEQSSSVDTEHGITLDLPAGCYEVLADIIYEKQYDCDGTRISVALRDGAEDLSLSGRRALREHALSPHVPENSACKDNYCYAEQPASNPEEELAHSLGAKNLPDSAADGLDAAVAIDYDDTDSALILLGSGNPETVRSILEPYILPSTR